MNTPQAGAGKAQGDPRLVPLVMSLFFAFGFCTVLVDTLIPKLKAMFTPAARSCRF